VLVDLVGLLQVEEMASVVHDGHAGTWAEESFGADSQLHADAAVRAAVQVERRLLGPLPAACSSRA
jgi:hypothetical protein